jgi:predicted acylesterase/phospholipase RssA
VEGFVHGVFEGGGAKGVLYAGALEGLLRRKLWFKAVAGSSAGAITAAMIAAGMTPAEIRDEKEPGLKAMARPTRWSGYRRMRWGTGFLDHERILDWLAGWGWTSTTVGQPSRPFPSERGSISSSSR